jgi:hypothetical protein
MAVYKVKGKYLIYRGEKSSEEKFRTELSAKLIEKFGNKTFDAEEITLIISYSLDYFVSRFKEICHGETSIRFYQHVFKFHDQATEASYNFPRQNLSEDISLSYLATYRRTLKLIMEMGCDISMHNNEKTSPALIERIEKQLSDLIYLGDMIFTCASLYAEQSMIEDVADISFSDKGLFVFSRRHHYNFIFEHLIKNSTEQLGEAVMDDSELNGFEDLKTAIKDCLGIGYDEVGHLIATIHEMNKEKGGDRVGVEWKTLPLNMEAMFGADLQNSELFFKGVTLDKNNKMDLLECAVKQYKLNRYLYRPIIIWSVDGTDYAFFSKHSWMETFIQLSSNAIPWGKAPKEWLQNRCLKEYVHRKEDDHDRWLDDVVEEKLKKNGLKYDRNVENTIHLKGRTSIDVQGLGEIDFIIISEEAKTLFIVDCKHLLGRYDIPSQRNDYNAFTSGKKPYNDTLERKIRWFERNLNLVKEHFQLKYDDKAIDLSDYKVEGVFIINTPTLYMYNSQYRIYTIPQIEDVFLGKHIDPTFSVVIDEELQTKFLNIDYPYFQKPNYMKFDLYDDLEE